MSRLKDVELDGTRLLEAAGLGSLADGLPTLYAGPYPTGAPDAFMACRASGGEAPERYLAGTGAARHQEVVTVLVRGQRGPSGYLDSRTRAHAAWEALFDSYPEGYVRVAAEGAGPTWLGEDEEGRPQWSFPVSAEYASSPP
jgi:hypothetical protein